MSELFKKVYIKTEADLPKEEGYYIVKFSKKFASIIAEEHFNESIKSAWLSEVDWYLQPIEQSEPVTVSDEEIKKHFYKTASFIYEGTQKIEFLTLKQVLKFAKWLLSKIEKK